MHVHQLIFDALWIVACGYAAVRGGLPERIAAACFFLAAPLTSMLGRPHSAIYGSPEWSIVGVDLGLFLVLMAVALYSCRYWPMLMASMQGCGLLGHLAKTLSPDIVAVAYFAIVSFLGFPMLVLLVVATRRHRRRLDRYGVDYAWVGELPPAYRAGWIVNERSAEQQAAGGARRARA